MHVCHREQKSFARKSPEKGGPGLNLMGQRFPTDAEEGGKGVEDGESI